MNNLFNDIIFKLKIIMAYNDSDNFNSYGDINNIIKLIKYFNYSIKDNYNNFINKFNINNETLKYDKLLEICKYINYLYFIIKDTINYSNDQYYDKKNELNMKCIENDIKKVSYIYYKIDYYLNNLVFVVDQYIKDNKSKNGENYKDN